MYLEKAEMCMRWDCGKFFYVNEITLALYHISFLYWQSVKNDSTHHYFLTSHFFYNVLAMNTIEPH